MNVEVHSSLTLVAMMPIDLNTPFIILDQT